MHLTQHSVIHGVGETQNATQRCSARRIKNDCTAQTVAHYCVSSVYVFVCTTKTKYIDENSMAFKIEWICSKCLSVVAIDKFQMRLQFFVYHILFESN